MAIAAIGAVIAGTATVVETVAAVGTVLSVVGAATGNKDLMKIGGVMGLVGAGIGLAEGLANGASAVAEPFVDATGAAEATNSLANTAANVAESGVPVGAESASGVPDTTGIASDTFNAGKDSQLANEQMANSASPDMAAQADRTVNTLDLTDSSGSGASDSASGTTSDINSAPTSSAQNLARSQADLSVKTPDSPVAPDAPNAPTSPADAEKLGTGIQDSKGFFGKTLDFLNDPKNKNLITLGGNVLSGIQKGQQFDQLYDLKAQENARANQMLANGSAQPAINIRVNPNANVFSNPAQQYNGIIPRVRG
jgi:hypothetical protein